VSAIFIVQAGVELGQLKF